MSDLNQIEMVSLDQLVDQDHPYRQLLAIVDFEKLCKPILDLDNVGRSGANGYWHCHAVPMPAAAIHRRHQRPRA